VTGASIPADKQAVPDAAAARADPDKLDPAHRVFAGTINGSGAIEIEVTRKTTDSALAKVVRMVSEAETQKSPTQRFTEKFERLFVPAVLALAVLLLFAWVVVDEPFRDSFYRAMAVLVAASPCALAIATPSAVLAGVARAARGGVLVKGGGPLENLGSLSAIAFDKTGTLTAGKPRITDVVPAPRVAENDWLRVAVAVESLSDHPLARAIARDGRERLGEDAVPHASELESLTGRGVAARRWRQGADRQGRNVRRRWHSAALQADAGRHRVAARGRAYDHGRAAGRPRPRRDRADGHATRGGQDGAGAPARARHPADDHDLRRPSEGRLGDRAPGRPRRLG